MHRVLPLPGRLPRHPRPRGEQDGLRRPALLRPVRPSSRCTRSTSTTDASSCRHEQGIGKCNITKCCTEVCPEHIKITDNAIIPLKERVVDASYDPIAWLGRKILGRTKRSAEAGGGVGPGRGSRGRAAGDVGARRPRARGNGTTT